MSAVSWGGSEKLHRSWSPYDYTKVQKKKNLPFKSLPRKSTFSKVTIFNTNKLYSSDSKDQLFSLV